MALLIDTHIFLWVASGSPKLKPAAKALIDAADEVFVSAASIWEIAIKSGLGKIVADPARLAALIEDIGFVELPVRAAHAARVAALPPLHADPFDRLLVAQAMHTPMRLLTADTLLAGYSDLVTVI